MAMNHKGLPIGIQNFREIREKDHDDVDKTPFALSLIEEATMTSSPDHDA